MLQRDEGAYDLIAVAESAATCGPGSQIDHPGGAPEKDRGRFPALERASQGSRLVGLAAQGGQREPAFALRQKGAQAQVVDESDGGQLAALGQVIECQVVDRIEIPQDIDDRALGCQ